MEFIYAIVALVVGVIGTYFVVGGKQKADNAVKDESHKREAEKILAEAKLKAEKTKDLWRVQGQTGVLQKRKDQGEPREIQPVQRRIQGRKGRRTRGA